MRSALRIVKLPRGSHGFITGITLTITSHRINLLSTKTSNPTENNGVATLNFVVSPEHDTTGATNSQQPALVLSMTDLKGAGSHEGGRCRVCFDIIDLSQIVHDSSGRVAPAKRLLGSITEVTSMPCPHSKSITTLWNSGKPVGKYATKTWLIDLCYLFNDFAFRFYDPELPELNTFYRTFDLIAKPDRYGHTGASRTIDANWIKPVVPQSWYNTCLREHGPKCEEPSWMAAQPWSFATPEWLIDAREWCLVPYNSKTSRYFTLSYTWGNANCLRTTAALLGLLQQPGSLRTNHLSRLPRTIRDAIEITEYLGETYLWVDSLCIVQDDAASLHNNLNNMHDIYARSALCLVAFAGLDANHGLKGLEGVSAPRAVDQLALPIADGETISWYNAPRARWDSFGESPKHIGRTYNERGWTFQEFVFAKRRLIFTDGPVRWICACTIWGEDKVGDLVIDNMTDMPFTKWKDRQRPGLASLLTDVASEYNVRHFTFWQDILNAFLGIQNHLHRTFVGGLNHGHPDMFFDISLLWEPETEISRRSSSEEAPTEERYLPTWSWMGWHGTFHFLSDAEYECCGRPSNGILEPVAQWFTFQPSASMNSMRLIKCDWYRHKQDSDLIHEGWRQHQEGLFEIGDAQFRYTVPVPSLALPVDPNEQSRLIFAKTTRAYFKARKLDVPSKLPDAELCVALHTFSGELAGFLRLHEKVDEASIIKRHSVELVAVVKGWTTDLSDEHHRVACCFALCVHWKGGVARRLGTCKVLDNVWEDEKKPVELILG